MKGIFNTYNSILASVLSALQYYSLFKYPLKAEEIYGNMPVACTLSSLLVALEDLESDGKIFMHDGYYAPDVDVKTWVTRRIAANQLAREKKVKAVKVGRFISKFPFVRFVGISGSLSKGYADEKSDFDFFIITDKNRLWICRTILHLFKKLTFLAGQQHKFCMNYFIDTENLEIEEKNRFTAIELSSLVPVSGYKTYMHLERSNEWVSNYLPNGFVGFYTGIDEIDDSKSYTKTLLEFVLDKISPELLNKRLMKLTDYKWRKKWARKNYPVEDYGLAFKTTLHISKNHHLNYQKKILKALAHFGD